MNRVAFVIRRKSAKADIIFLLEREMDRFIFSSSRRKF